jgi:hypothetical protein
MTLMTYGVTVIAHAQIFEYFMAIIEIKKDIMLIFTFYKNRIINSKKN